MLCILLLVVKILVRIEEVEDDALDVVVNKQYLGKSCAASLEVDKGRYRVLGYAIWNVLEYVE